jgi:translin
MNRTARDHPDLESAGYALDAQKEYAEAWLTRALLARQPIPAPEDLGVDDAAWLNGLGEAAGELRRAALDRIRGGDVEGAEELLGHMDDIHAFLSSVDFPSAITRDIKRTNDMVRGVTERTRGDLTVAARQEALRSALERFEATVGGT